MPWALALLEDCPPGEWSERMLIGCPGPGETKARELSDEHSQKRCAPDTAVSNLLQKRSTDRAYPYPKAAATENPRLKTFKKTDYKRAQNYLAKHLHNYTESNCSA